MRPLVSPIMSCVTEAARGTVLLWLLAPAIALGGPLDEARTLEEVGFPMAAELHYADAAGPQAAPAVLELAIDGLLRTIELHGDTTTLTMLALALPPERRPAAHADQLAWLAAVAHFENSRSDTAHRELDRVAETSPLYPRALFLRAVLLARAGKLKSSMKAFREVFDGAGSEPSSAEDRRLRELSRMNMARIWFSIERYEVAAELYEQIPLESEYWDASRFELATARLMSWDPPGFDPVRATIEQIGARPSGNTAPVGWLPERDWTLGVAAYTGCAYVEALAAADRLLSEVGPLADELERFVQDHRQSAMPSAWFDDASGMAVRYPSLNNRLGREHILAGSLQKIELLEEERARFDAQPRRWRRIAGAALPEELDAELERTRTRAGRRMEYLLRSQQQWLRQLQWWSQYLRFEVIEAVAYDAVWSETCTIPELPPPPPLELKCEGQPDFEYSDDGSLSDNRRSARLENIRFLESSLMDPVLTPEWRSDLQARLGQHLADEADTVDEAQRRCREQCGSCTTADTTRSPSALREEAIRHLVLALPDAELPDEVLYALGVVQWEAGQHDAAAGSLSTLVVEHPGSPFATEAWARLAGYHLEQGQVDEARLAWRQARDLSLSAAASKER